MVLKDLKKMSISAKTMSLMVASLFAADGADGCTGYTIQVSVCCTMVYKGMIVILVLAFGPAPVI